jgi:hypothetical protein
VNVFFEIFNMTGHSVNNIPVHLKVRTPWLSAFSFGCISNCRDRMLNLGKHNTWLAKSFIMQGHNDHKGGTPDSNREITT